MEGGFTTDALIDMTGGIEEAFELNSASATSKDFREQIKRGPLASVSAQIHARMFDHCTLNSAPKGH